MKTQDNERPEREIETTIVHFLDRALLYLMTVRIGRGGRGGGGGAAHSSPHRGPMHTSSPTYLPER